MRTRHQLCRNGIIEDVTICENCKGTGSLGFNLGVGASKGKICPECKGKGKLINKTTCEDCVDGFIYACDFCGNQIEGEDSNVDATCEENPIIIELAQPLDYRYLDGKNALAGKVVTIDNRGVKVDLNNGFIGHFKPPKGAKIREGQVVPVRLRRPLSRDDRGKSVSLYYVNTDLKYKVVKKHLNVYDVTLEELMSSEGNVGKVLTQIIDIYVIKNGPTLYTLMDENGKTVQGSVYRDDGLQAYPYLNKGTIVSTIARFRIHNDKPRLQIYNLEKSKGNDALNFLETLSGINQTDGAPIDETTFFIESTVYDQLKPDVVQGAKRIRKAILRSQNIIIRYHSPCVDGASAAFGVDYAIKRNLLSRGVSKNEFRRYVRRIPQRNSIFEIREVTRDLSFALDDGANYKNLPLYVLIDLGSNNESKAALALCKAYNVDVIIIDTHHAVEGIEELVNTLINPSKHSRDQLVTTAMLGIELAKFISAEQMIDERVMQLAAISGFSDNLSSDEYTKYVELAEKNEFDSAKIENIAYALDYVLFGLRHFDGGEVVRNLLGISGSSEKTTELLESITPTAKSLSIASLNIALANSTTSDGRGKEKVVLLDLESFAPRFEYPSYSSVLSSLHSSKVDELKAPVTTIGVASDYMIIRSNSDGFEFSNLLNSVQEANADLALAGNGNKNSGSIQFLSGFKDKVIESVTQILSE